MFKVMPKDDTVTKSIRMPEQMLSRLTKVAKKNNLTFTDVVLQCIEYALDCMEDDG